MGKGWGVVWSGEGRDSGSSDFLVMTQESNRVSAVNPF